MEYVISENIVFSQKYNPYELLLINAGKEEESTEEINPLISWGYNPIRIKIKNIWYDVFTASEMIRMRSTRDDAFHFLYIQINWKTDEYYIGKVNRKRWGEVRRYQGSGVVFKQKYKAHSQEFGRYYFACFETQEQSEQMEATIVDEELLKDPKCLNLVRGGGGTSQHHGDEERKEKLRAYMKAHPDQYKAMMEKAKELYHSGESDALKERGKAIKKTMSDEYYKQLSRDRILTWKEEKPEEYRKMRENNRQSARSEASRSKRRESRNKWIANNPEKHEEYQRRLITARNTPEARKKKAASLKEWYSKHPEEAAQNIQKRLAASAEKTRKKVNMCDLETGAIIMTFESQTAAAQWLVDKGIAKNLNCKNSISAVCRKKPCTYGVRKKAYGYGWNFAD